ncbi:MAG: dynamin family protein [Treponema sp.]
MLECERLSAEEYREIYEERKNKVLLLLEQAKEYFIEVGKEKEAKDCEKQYQDLENGEFSVVVVGEFSSGKSTLLNALMGKKILPSFSNETTATINFLRHSDKAENGEAGRVFLNDGNEKVIENASFDVIKKYVSTDGEDVAKRVHHLDLYLDSDFLNDNVTLVDSPGLNGTADGHREITEAQIRDSHASIFVFSSDHPGSKTDFEFLHELRKKVKTIIFVLNKIDFIKKDEGETPEKIIESLINRYKEIFPEEESIPEIWPVAALPALVARNSESLEYDHKRERTADEKKELEKSSRLKEFENRLFSFLTHGEKAKKQLLVPVEKILSFSEEIQAGYRDEKELLENSEDSFEIERRIADIRQVIDGLEDEIAGIRNNVGTTIREATKDIKNELENKIDKMQKRKLDSIVAEEYENIDDLINDIEGFGDEFIKNAQTIIKTQEEELKEEIINIINIEYSKQVEEIKAKLSEENRNISIFISEKFEVGKSIFEFGQKNMDAKIKDYEAKLKNIEKEIACAEEKYYNAKNKEMQIQELKDEIKNMREKMENLEDRTTLPPIYKRVVIENNKKFRGGIFGGFEFLLVGGMDVVEDKEIIDDTERKNEIKTRNEEINRYNNYINIKNNQLKNLGDSNSDYEMNKITRKQEEYHSMKQELKEYIEKNTEEIRQKSSRKIKEVKRKLRNYSDNITETIMGIAKNELRKAESDYIEIILSTVEGKLSADLNSRMKQLEGFERDLHSSEEDKAKKLVELDSKIEKLENLMSDAVRLETALKNIEVDEIEQKQL